MRRKQLVKRIKDKASICETQANLAKASGNKTDAKFYENMQTMYMRFVNEGVKFPGIMSAAKAKFITIRNSS